VLIVVTTRWQTLTMIFVRNFSKKSPVTSREKEAVHLVDKTNNQLLCYGNKLLSPAIQFQRMELCLLTTISCASGLTLFCSSLFYPSVFLSPDAPSLTRVSSAPTVSPPRDVLHCTSLPTVACRAGAWPKVRGRAKIAFCCLDRLLLLRISVQHRILPLFFKKGKTHNTYILQEKQEGGSALLTPWSRVLLQKLTGFQIVKKFPAFYGTRRFITAFTSAGHLSLSWARSIQSMSTILLLEYPF
jgi:hypothetical protein